ncbi:GreA/GreB family elongation factor [Algiphilus aromaticivorans]|jgi:transcription elongation factor GreB|uniref:GreA/GreB family elongation factor n=1 Tax=Algiphilus aromaticivorans TaxID=382454 RepID=UPI0005C2267E|nr:GreA/GreB family elongation factor [Algiphilus aromaticivorans]
MSRWRPPSTERASPYITSAGYRRMQQEYDHLWRERRPAVVRALAAAAAEGDRSENAEYQYRKKELGEIDRRVRYLQRRLPALRVPPFPDDRSRIHFAACVRISVDGDVERELQLVGADEAEAASGMVSVDAPLPRALLGRSEGDVFVHSTPGGEQEIEILEVRYPEPECAD